MMSPPPTLPPDQQGRVTRVLQRIGKVFAASCTMLVLVCLLVAGLNLALRPFAGPLMPVTKIGALPDWGKKEADRWVESYGFDTLRKVYSGKSDDEIRQLIYTKFRLGNRYSTYVEFNHEPVVAYDLAVHDAGFRLIGKEQCAWPIDNSHLNVFMFGGSTMLGAGAADDETAAAYMQEALRARLGQDICVYNFGVGAYYSNQEVVSFWKMASQGIRPDAVFFLDGLNDYFQTTEDTAHSGYYREFEKVIISLQTQLMIDRGSLWSLWQAWLQSPAVRWARNFNQRELTLATPGREEIPTAAKRMDPNYVPELTKVRSFNDTNDRAHIEHVTMRLLNNFRLAGAMAHAIGAEAAFIVQPTPMYEFDLSKHLFSVPEWHQYTRIGYPLLKERLAAWDGHERVAWCADVGKDAGEEKLYFDPVHYAPPMNRRIVNCVLAQLEADGGLAKLQAKQASLAK